jgi:hypothetical protein
MRAHAAKHRLAVKKDLQPQQRLVSLSKIMIITRRLNRLYRTARARGFSDTLRILGELLVMEMKIEWVRAWQERRFDREYRWNWIAKKAYGVDSIMQGWPYFLTQSLQPATVQKIGVPGTPR